VHTKPDSQIFIDFEGNKDKAPTFLGVLERTGSHMRFYQYILEDTFKVLTHSSQHLQLSNTTLIQVLKDLDARFDSNTPIYAWSSHEQNLIAESIVNNELAHLWNHRIIDAKKLAKRWAKVVYPEHKFETKAFRGRHTLDQYLELINYKVPTVHGAGKTGARLTVIREMISTGRMFEDWPPSVKSHWTKLLAHNKHDCFGMMAIVDAMNSPIN
jgi:hypothetical protein